MVASVDVGLWLDLRWFIPLLLFTQTMLVLSASTPTDAPPPPPPPSQVCYKLSIHLIKLTANFPLPCGIKCKPFLPRYDSVIFLLSITLMPSFYKLTLAMLPVSLARWLSNLVIIDERIMLHVDNIDEM